MDFLSWLLPYKEWKSKYKREKLRWILCIVEDNEPFEDIYTLVLEACEYVSYLKGKKKKKPNNLCRWEEG